MSRRESLRADDGEGRNLHRSARIPPAARRHAGHIGLNHDTAGHSPISRLCRIPGQALPGLCRSDCLALLGHWPKSYGVIVRYERSPRINGHGHARGTVRVESRTYAERS